MINELFAQKLPKLHCVCCVKSEFRSPFCRANLIAKSSNLTVACSLLTWTGGKVKELVVGFGDVLFAVAVDVNC